MGTQSDNGNVDERVGAIVDERLTLAAFRQLSGHLGGYPFVKLVVDRPGGSIHFLNNAVYPMHGGYIAEQFLGITMAQLTAKVDEYNHGFYKDPDRTYYLGILSLHEREGRAFFALETVEIDNMGVDMLRYFHGFVREWVDPSVRLVLKPANHAQEQAVAGVDPTELPRVLSHQLFSTAPFIPLHPGTTRGRLRVFTSEEDYAAQRDSLEWFDIIAMERVPDDIPRLAGIINAAHTTPLSHTNVLATGWQIPNCIQIGVIERAAEQGLGGEWVELVVSADAEEVGLTRIERPAEVDTRPAWKALRVTIEEPETTRTPIQRLSKLRMADRYRYGTKAANLGELVHVLEHGSERLDGFYRVRRPPRDNLLPQLADLLGVPQGEELAPACGQFLRDHLRVPVGIAIPFHFQREFLESSPQIQQTIGKLKMALELGARQVDSLCVTLQQMVRATRIPDKIRSYIDSQVAATLAGVSSFVVRSSSNAEDLEGFSAAGIYESINHVTTADRLFESVKRVWGSLLSPRSVRLRQEVGISLEDSYMGVIIQEEVPASMGGVLVTANPLKRDDFRNVYYNLSLTGVEDIVAGTEQAQQYLYNTIEGGGRTLSLGEGQTELSEPRKQQLQRLAVAGRLLQAHFSPDYTFASPVDIEWIAGDAEVTILQLRPYAW